MLDDVEHLIKDAQARTEWSTVPGGAVPTQLASTRRPRVTKGPPALTLLPSKPTQPHLSLADWIELVNERPNEAPHISIFGPSGSSKTTLAHALMATRRGQFVVIDPKPVLPGTVKWCGVPYVVIDDDGGYGAIEAQLQVSELILNVLSDSILNVLLEFRSL